MAGDSLQCTTRTVHGHSCSPETGCVTTNDNTNVCADTNLCNGNETCQAGTCAAGTPVVCNDGNVCTTDSCNPGTGACGFANNTNPCDDGNPGTAGDTCAGGVCVGGQTCGTLLNENFEAYASGANPANWFEPARTTACRRQTTSRCSRSAARRSSARPRRHQHPLALRPPLSANGRTTRSPAGLDLDDLIQHCVTVLSNYPAPTSTTRCAGAPAPELGSAGRARASRAAEHGVSPSATLVQVQDPGHGDQFADADLVKVWRRAPVNPGAGRPLTDPLHAAHDRQVGV